jgi:hypothetical protein
MMIEVQIRPREYCELARLGARGKRRVSHKAHGSIQWLHDQLWEAMIAADPEPADFERALFEYALELDPANGPIAALAGEIIADWRWARADPNYVAWLRARRAADAEASVARRAP